MLPIFFGLILCTDAYVLLQVRQGSNQSNVDAVIHKVIPAEKGQRITDKINDKAQVERKLFSHKVNHKKGFDKLQEVVVKLLNDFVPSFRGYDTAWKKQTNREVPSVVFEMDAKAIIRTLKKILYSKEAQHYMDDIAQKAAVVYRVIADEVNNSK